MQILCTIRMSRKTLTSRFANAYFNQSTHKINFIVVDWRKGSNTFNYLHARNRVNLVAAHVAKFIDFMSIKARLKIEYLTIVGHSLGAHIAGIAAKQITVGKVGKIVGLDPASPLFKYEDVNNRLADTDASYVESMHTCAGRLGMTKPIGMASFYPNGGRRQPGCKLDLVDVGTCSHKRASAYYIESIIRSEFYALRCESFQ